MSRLDSAFAPDRKALIAYVTVGYPSVETTLAVVPALVAAGCDVVELGIPFSDPVADGPTIQRASFGALRRRVTPKLCLEVAARLRATVAAPLLFMGYYNPILSYGLTSFCSSAAAAGIDGLLVPDLPPEEGEALEAAARQHDIDIVYFLAPNSNQSRLELVTQRSRGFVYLVSLTGVTGRRDRLPAELEAFVGRVRTHTKLPLCVGFGIGSPEEARRVAAIADGVIVGSRFIELLESPDDPVAAAADFARSLRRALSEATPAAPTGTR